MHDGRGGVREWGLMQPGWLISKVVTCQMGQGEVTNPGAGVAGPVRTTQQMMQSVLTLRAQS